jgi:choline dehydrogenase-like flavoprotein
MNKLRVIGAGLAGCEAAWQAARRGVPVILSEMKPSRYSPAHHHPGFAELVCSNSLRSADPSNAVGLLKEELSALGSLIMEAALATAVPAGSALAVDRALFSEFITEKIRSHPLIEVRENEETNIDTDPDTVTVIATGPLTDGKMADAIAALTDISLANNETSPELAASLSQAIENAKVIVSQKLGRVVIPMTIYMQTRNTYTVRVAALYDQKQAMKIAHDAVLQELAQESEENKKQLESLLGMDKIQNQYNNMTFEE